MIKEKPDQIKYVTFKIKCLQQKLRPIVVGAGATRPYIYVNFVEEAHAQFTKDTIVYLSWIHEGTKVKGYNAFTAVSRKPNVWKILLPASLLKHEGTVLARLELVDSKSIAASRTFEINVLYNPNQDETFTDSDDYGIFQDAILELTDKINQTSDLLKDTQNTVDDLNDLFNKIQEFYDKILEEKEEQDRKIDSALSNSYESLKIAIEALNQLAWGSVN